MSKKIKHSIMEVAAQNAARARTVLKMPDKEFEEAIRVFRESESKSDFPFVDILSGEEFADLLVRSREFKKKYPDA